MIEGDQVDEPRIPLSASQQNIFNGVLQDADPALYLIGRSYRFASLELPVLLAAIRATITGNPVLLCALDDTGADYPDLVPVLGIDDIVEVRPDDGCASGSGGAQLQEAWRRELVGAPLVRFTVRVDHRGRPTALDVHAHHILLDGGATGLVEADLGRHIAAGGQAESLSVGAALAKLAQAHRRENTLIQDARQRLTQAARREIVEQAHSGGYRRVSRDAPATAAKGVLRESVRISGSAFEEILGVSATHQVPLNVLVAAAAVAVDASDRQSTESVLVHAIDNRFGEPDLGVATCLVNSVAQHLRFAAFASVEDVVRAMDRGYVKAARRRWLREEHYRRMYLAINRTSQVEALTLNFLSQPCAPELRPFLSDAPLTTDIGPVESRTVAAVLDAERGVLELAVWDRADVERAVDSAVAERIGTALASMAAMWHQPIAMIVGQWLAIGADGSLTRGGVSTSSGADHASAWFSDTTAGLRSALVHRDFVYPWIGWLVQNGVVPGDVVVLDDEGTDKTIDLLIACHLAGCGYSVCDNGDDVETRAAAIAEHDAGSTHRVDVAGTRLADGLADDVSALVEDRLRAAAVDPMLPERTAYVMPTSGSTGEPKLVRITHRSLALFCTAIRHAYGWNPSDTVIQCAPLTSDISVEEIFGAAFCGARIVRSPAMRAGDLPGLVADLKAAGASVVDLPTAVWHLLCEDSDALAAIVGSSLRQVIVGGEDIRPRAVDTWVKASVGQPIQLLSTYGPTEATVVVSYLQVVTDDSVLDSAARRRIGRALVPWTVFVVFGEVVVIGNLVSTGYLGLESENFGVVAAVDGSRHRAFATADRVSLDQDGLPVFCGRRDALVKIGGRRVDAAEVARCVSQEPGVTDVAVELRDERLGVWFETARTRAGDGDEEAQARIRSILVGLRVPSFVVVGLSTVPRKANGKVDSARLPALPPSAAPSVDESDGPTASGLAELWGRHLGRPIRPESSLLDEGVGSLDLIRILPDTRRYLRRHLTILDVISADTAANLVEHSHAVDSWIDDVTRTEIEQDLAAVSEARFIGPGAEAVAGETVLILGASGILGTGFAGAVLDRRRAGDSAGVFAFAARSTPSSGLWTDLAACAAVRVERLATDCGATELARLIHRVGAATVVNCIGNTNVVVPYRKLRSANVAVVGAVAEACARSGARLVHLSTYVVNADVNVPLVTDPRAAPYPYAASKSLAELTVAGAGDVLDFRIVRLPRVLGEPVQTRDSADVLVSLAAACAAVQAHPDVTLTEQVTTGRAAATGLLRWLAARPGVHELGRGITVVRGEALDYGAFLSEFGAERLEATEWKRRVDASEWAQRNPRRWSVIDAWISLGMRLRGRSYSEYLAEYPTLPVDAQSVDVCDTTPGSLRRLIENGRELNSSVRRL